MSEIPTHNPPVGSLPTEKRTPYRLETKIGSNPLLLSLLSQFNQIPPNWQQIMAVFKKTKYFKRHYKYHTSPDPSYEQLSISMMAEIHFRQTIRQLAEACRDLVDMDPARLNQPQKYHWRNNEFFMAVDPNDSVHVVKISDGQPYKEIDDFFKIGGLMTYVELKPFEHKRYRGVKYSGHSLHEVFKKEKIDQSTKPLRQMAGSNCCAYVIFCAPDMVDGKNPDQIRFAKIGGILLPFFPTVTEAENFRRQAAQVIAQRILFPG